MANAAKPSPLLALQVVVAATLPWLTARVVAPGVAVWSVLAVLGVVLFAVLHARSRLVVLLPASAVVSVLPGVPAAVAAVAALAAAVALLARPPADHAGRGVALRWAGAAMLMGAGLVITVAAVLAAQESDATFEARQQAAAEAWDAPLVAAPGIATRPVTNEPGESQGSAPGRDSASGNAAGAMEGTGPPAADSGNDPAALAQLAFHRPGTDQVPVTDQLLYVGTDVTEAALAAGPGHYPSTSLPGRAGNFAVAGHRTGWGSPFLELDELKAGDEVLVTDRNERTFTYVVAESVLVDPDESWVLGQDPLGTGQPTLTLTTCDPPNVNDRRLIVFGILSEEG